MDRTRRAAKPQPSNPGRDGFSLVELLLAILIVGILAAVGIGNYRSIQERARYASCVSNKRNLLESTIHYISEQNPGTKSFNASFLTTSGYVTAGVCECPSSNLDDFDDYTIEIANNITTTIKCSIEPIDHDWTLP